MFVSLIIVFREAMEAGLIVGIVLAATEGVPGRGRWIAGGIAAGIAGASLVAAFAAALSDAFEGAGQEVFTAAILCFAVVMLSWHILWMSHHARTMAAELREVGKAVRLGQRSLVRPGRRRRRRGDAGGVGGRAVPLRHRRRVRTPARFRSPPAAWPAWALPA